LTSLSFVEENIDFINNAGRIYRTADGGQSWIVQQVNTVKAIVYLIIISATEGFACSSQSIYKTTKGSISPLDIEMNSVFLLIYTQILVKL
jgi:photosystem II stability/assembly factor-like uncharacterized protein